jgi:hypothetical protein
LSQNIDKKLVPKKECLKARIIVISYLKSSFISQKSGKLTIEPLSMDDVQLPTNRRDVFGRVVIADDVKRVSAGAKTINVKALPESESHLISGAVGILISK